MEVSLLKEIKSQSESERKVQSLLNLGSIYYYKPLNRIQALEKCLIYARQAKIQASKLNDRDNFNKAVLLIADALIQLSRITDAEKELPDLHDKAKIDLLLMLAFQYRLRLEGTSSSNFQKASQYLDTAAALANKFNDCTTGIRISGIKGSILAQQGRFVESEQILLAAASKAGKNHCIPPQYLDLELTNLYNQKGDYDKALLFGIKAVREAENKSDSLCIGDANYALGFIFRNTGKFQDAADHYNKAMKCYILFPGIQTTLAESIEAIGQIMISKKEYKNALIFFQKSYPKYHLGTYQSKLIEAGDIGDCYLKLKNYKQAERYFLKEFHLAQSVQDLDEATYHRLAFFYVESGAYQKALPYLQEALKRRNEASVQSNGHLYYMFFLADSALGDYKSAMKYLGANKRCDDIIYQESKVAAMHDLQNKYEADKKSEEIKLLTKSEQLEHANLRNAETFRNISICGTIAFALVGAIYYKQYRRKLQMSSVIQKKNQQLQVLLQDKEWLLREVHHRVKNNLHTVICLLQIQAEFLKDDALKAIETSQHRIYAMSLIHQKLYLTDESETINLQIYLEDLIGYLKESLRSDQPICYRLDLKPLNVDISAAIPIGLIVNEAITNAIKHAFVGRKENNVISIKLDEAGEEVQLIIGDNGIGINLSNDPLKWGSLGLKMIRGLCQDLEAALEIKNIKGTQFDIRFSKSTKRNP
ncbi:histidine kinase dimerization/phosphoacceptor domain -containing protein [Mucilaginibacter angelicae]|uniref:histidine kinase n=1 Tax=Mucilaginibacter angelicae TaxID=869718 RepID=A0ABV6L498_9SPHI